MKRIDLHTHTFFSDGELLPAELIRRAEELGHEAIALTDHVGPSNLNRVLECTLEAAEKLTENTDVRVIPGVELTHVPLSMIPDLAKRAQERGADLVVAHGETLVEPVLPGTNLASLKCEEVDILSHPGMLSLEEAELAADNGTYLELTSRDGHCLTNGRVASLAMETGAELLVNTDAHSPEDLITYEESRAIAEGAGLEENMLKKVLEENPKEILEAI